MSGTTTLTTRERQRLREATERGYFVNTARRRVDGANAWWEQCEQEMRPYVRVDVHKGKRASVLVDLLTCGGLFGDGVLERIRKLWLAHTLPGSAFFPGHVQVILYGIRLKEAEYLARALMKEADA